MNEVPDEDDNTYGLQPLTARTASRCSIQPKPPADRGTDDPASGDVTVSGRTALARIVGAGSPSCRAWRTVKVRVRASQADADTGADQPTVNGIIYRWRTATTADDLASATWRTWRLVEEGVDMEPPPAGLDEREHEITVEATEPTGAAQAWYDFEVHFVDGVEYIDEISAVSMRQIRCIDDDAAGGGLHPASVCSARPAVSTDGGVGACKG